VSSSGHLAILQRLFGITTDGLAIAVILHLGTMLALLVFFFKDILALRRKPELVLFIILVTIVTGAIGVPGKHFFEHLFTSPKAIAVCWVITGTVLLLTGRCKKGSREIVGFLDALILGIAQGLAIAPGISRSGITISTLLFRKIEPQECFRLSFLAGIPAIAGAALLESKEIGLVFHLHPAVLAASFLVSFLTGLCALGILKFVMRKEKLYYFGYYCIIVAVLTFLFVK
jgi:undecaprenyl-diphosphatase